MIGCWMLGRVCGDNRVVCPDRWAYEARGGSEVLTLVSDMFGPENLDALRSSSSVPSLAMMTSAARRFSSIGPLGGFALVELGLRPAPGVGAGEAHFAGGVDHQRRGRRSAPTRLPAEMERRGRRPVARGAELSGLRLKPAAEFGGEGGPRETGVRPSRRPVFGENAAGDGRPIDAAIGREDSVTPALANRVADLGILGQHVVASAVGVQRPAPSSTNIFATSDLPLATPPTRPMVFIVDRATSLGRSGLSDIVANQALAAMRNSFRSHRADSRRHENLTREA